MRILIAVVSAFLAGVFVALGSINAEYHRGWFLFAALVYLSILLYWVNRQEDE